MVFLSKLILGFLALIGLLKLYLKLTTKKNKSKVTLYGKTAIVTGANTGVGYETALDLASRGARVILACRNSQLAEEARRKIIAETGNENVVVKLIDFSSLKSVRAFAKDVNATEPRLDILINNAGATNLGSSRTEDGLHILMQVNYFGPFLLTNLLINLLKNSAPSRIVNVSSGAAEIANLDLDNLNEPSGGNFFTELTGVDYCNTKLCNILMSNELAERLIGTGVTSNSLHPGVVQTEIGRNFAGYGKYIFAFVFLVFAKTSEEGAQTQIFAAVANEMENVSGKYLDNVQIANMPKTVRPGMGKKLWEKSVEFVKLRPEEIQI